jgi:hypothetical protein
MLDPVICDDGDECTEDLCEPTTGQCEFDRLAFDLDEDGFNGPRAGFSPGAPGACGDDCDDTSALAFPGGIERCDGVDNDCNGIVDEDAAFVATGAEPVLVSENAREASGGGIAYNGDFYGVVFSDKDESWQNTFKGLDAFGGTRIPQQGVTLVNTDSFTGPLVWTGRVFATAWEDRRDGDFEVYFNRLDADGNKLGADVRITNAPEFSLHPDLLFNGSEYVVVWSDERNGSGDFRIYGQRVSVDGTLLGENVELTPGGLDAQGPSIAEGQSSLGLLFNIEGPSGRQTAFRTLSTDMSPASDLIVLGAQNAVQGSVVFNRDRYVAVWHLRDVQPGDAVYGAAIAEDGTVLIPETRLTDSAAFALSGSILPLGDRLLIVWSEWRDDGYDLFTRMLTADLAPLTVAEQVTFSNADAVGPAAAFGPDGDVGIVYEDARSGSWQVYFTRLSCLPAR